MSSVETRCNGVHGSTKHAWEHAVRSTQYAAYMWLPLPYVGLRDEHVLHVALIVRRTACIIAWGAHDLVFCLLRHLDLDAPSN